MNEKGKEFEERVERLSYKLRRHYEDSFDPYYDDLAENIISILENKFGTDEKAIERLTDIDIAFELYNYLSSINFEEYKRFVEKEYNQAPEKIRTTFSPLDLYFWKWKFGFDIEKAYRWHKVKENHTIFLSFDDIPTIDKYLTPEEADFLLNEFDIRGKDLITILEFYGRDVVKKDLKEVAEELKRIKESKKIQKWLKDFQQFESLYNLHKEIYERYKTLRKEKRLSGHLGSLLNGEEIQLIVDYRRMGGRRIKIMWLDGTIEEALSLKDVICVGWYDEPSSVIDYPEPHEIYFAKPGRLRYSASNVYRVNLNKAVEILKSYGLIRGDIDIEKEIEENKFLQEELKTLEIKHANLANNCRAVWLPISKESEVLLYIPSLLDHEGEINTDEIKFIEKRFREVKNYIESLLQKNVEINTNPEP